MSLRSFIVQVWPKLARDLLQVHSKDFMRGKSKSPTTFQILLVLVRSFDEDHDRFFKLF
jgi:hypothetical protein